MTTRHLGYVIVTPSGIDEHDRPYTIYRIYKPNPLTALSSDDHFDGTDAALEAAKLFIEEHLERNK